MTNESESREFRDAMGLFATGVTVIGVSHEGVTRGMTANAFVSLSLEPRMLLVCIDQKSSLYSVMQELNYFSVNILSEDQKDISDLFSRRGEKKEEMGGYPFRIGISGAPILEGVLAWAECKVEARHRGGDHMIVVGRVSDFSIARPDTEPLLFFRGKYHALGEVL